MRFINKGNSRLTDKQLPKEKRKKPCRGRGGALGKKLLLEVWVLLLLTVLPVNYALAESTPEEKLIEEQINSSEVDTIEKQMDKYSEDEIKEIIPEFDPHQIISDAAKGNFKLNLPGIFNRIVSYLFKEILTNVDILIKLIVLAVFCAVLKNLQASFMSDSIGELAFYACYIVIVTILLVCFNASLNMCTKIIDSMVAFMQATIPVMVTLLVSSGNLASGGVFQPILIVVVEISGTIMRNVFIPLIFFSAILSIVNNISDKVQISKLAGFFKQISGWALGIMLTVFVGIVAIQGSLGAVVDGVTSKTAKFAIGAFIPVAGKYLADAADAVIGCTLLIKNAAGVGIMIGIIAICLVPMLKILAVVILYRLACLVVEPLADKRIVDCINDMANSLTYVAGIVAAVTFMFLIAITAIIGASNIAAMVR